MTKFKIWETGTGKEIEIGQKVLVFRCGSGRSYFGEFATFERVTKQHLVFKTESGVTVKTSIDNIHDVIGKAGKEGYSVTTNVANRENDENFYKRSVSL